MMFSIPFAPFRGDRPRRGAVLPLVGAGIFVFLGISALVVDIGRVYFEKVRLDQVAESAALAGGHELGILVAAGIEIGSAEEALVRDAAIRNARSNGLDLVPGDVLVAHDRVRVHKPRTIDYTIARIMGFESKEIAGEATVRVQGDGRSRVSLDRYSIMPWAMAHGTVGEPYNVPDKQVDFTPLERLVPGSEYILKLGGGPQAGGLYYPQGTQVLIPMGGAPGQWDQWNIAFKRAYGLAYWLAGNGVPVKWLLNYRGGSFLFDLDEPLMRQLGAMRTSGGGEFGDAGILLDPDHFQWVRYEIVEDATLIMQQTQSMIVLDRTPRVGVYSSNEDAVTRTLDDAGIPYTLFHDTDLMNGALVNYDWLHLHHEDFTGAGGDGGLAVPTVTVTDKTGDLVAGPPGGTIWVRGSGFLNYRDGHRNIKIWFRNTQLRLADTATYSTDFLSADAMLVNADDNGRFEVTCLVPPLPNGVYRVYAQVRDEYSNYVDYTITGASLAPGLTLDDGAGDPLEGPSGALLTLRGTGYPAGATGIGIRFGGSAVPAGSTTAAFPDDAVASGLITCGAAGAFEVTLPVPAFLPDGPHTVTAVFEGATGETVIYRINNYRAPRIAVADGAGDPRRGPAGGMVVVTGHAFRPGQAGVTVRFGGVAMPLADTATYADDHVVGGTDVTVDAAGRFEAAFPAPFLAAGTYAVQAVHPDPLTGATVSSNEEPYLLLDPGALVPELSAADGAGDPAAGPPGGSVRLEGEHLAPGAAFVLSFDIPGTPLSLVDASGIDGDAVAADGRSVTANGEGRFAVTVTLPDLAPGPVEFALRPAGGGAPLAVAPYHVEERARFLTVTDEAEPHDAGLPGTMIRVRGEGFTPGAGGLLVRFGAAVLVPADTDAYPGDGVSGGAAVADAEGRFEVACTLPLLPPGVYSVRVEGAAPDISLACAYTLEPAEGFAVSNSASFDPPADAFVVGDTLHLAALCTRVDPAAMTLARATVSCAYHGGSHVATVPLSHAGDFRFTGSVAWAAVPGVHNGDWTVAFQLADSRGAVYAPTAVVHVTGTANVVPDAIVSRTANFSDAKPMLCATEPQYLKIQSPDVDYSDMQTADFRFVCRTAFESSGIEADLHGTGNLPFTNHWDGTWSASVACPWAGQHYGDHLVRMRIVDRLGRTHESIKEVCFFAAADKSLLVSAYPRFDYATTNFYKHGMLYARTFLRVANHQSMNRAEWRMRRYHPTNKSNYTSYFPLVNEGNGMFRAEIDLSALQNRADYTSFRLYTYLADTAGNSYYTDRQFDLRSTVGDWPAPVRDAFASAAPRALLGSLAAVAGRTAARACAAESPLRPVRLEFVNGELFADGVRHPASSAPRAPVTPPAVPRFAAAPEGAPFAGEPTAASIVRSVAPDRNHAPAPGHESCGCAALRALVARYLRAEPDTPVWWVAEHGSADPERIPDTADQDGGLRGWFASPARAQSYKGKYEIVHRIRDWVLAGGYLFAMCYGSETLDITLSKDNKGKLIGYDQTLAFTGFGSNRINDNDAGNFALQDMTASGDRYDRPLAAVQNHLATLDGFTGSCTAFKRAYIKATTGPGAAPVHQTGVIDAGTAKYICAAYGEGWFTFLGGHDPRVTEVYRLILNNVLAGSLSSTIPTDRNANYVVLDMDNTDDGEANDKGQYARNAKYGFPPDLRGEIVTDWPGELPGDPLYDTLPFNLPDETKAAVDFRVAQDLARAEPGEFHTWRTPEAYSSRFVLVPLCSVYLSDGTLACANPENLAEPQPEQVYQVRGRDRVRLMRYGLFFLSGTEPRAHADPDLAETGSLRPGEVRGKFVGYLR